MGIAAIASQEWGELGVLLLLCRANLESIVRVRAEPSSIGGGALHEWGLGDRPLDSLLSRADLFRDGGNRMLMKHRIVTCGLLAFAMTGCQTSRSVTNHIVQWRPFGKSTATASFEDKVADHRPSLEDADGEEQELEKLLAEQKAKPARDVVPASALDDSFDSFLKSVEQSRKEKAASSANQTTPTNAPVKTATEKVAKTKPQSKHEELSNQVERLLAEGNGPDGKAPQAIDPLQGLQEENQAEESPQDLHPWATAAKPQPVSQQLNVQTAGLSQPQRTDNDASQVAYDLASFADISIRKELQKSRKERSDIASLIAEEQTQQSVDSAVVATVSATTEADLSFEDWARQQASGASEKIKTAQQEVNSEESTPVESDFPWASQTAAKQDDNKAAESVQPATAKMLVQEHADSSVSDSQQAVAAQDIGVAKLEDLAQRPLVSSEILEMLEEALGGEEWKNSRASISREAGELSDEEQQIVRLMRDKKAQVRLKGIRLSLEKGQAESPLADEVERLLVDNDAAVRAHAASALYQWNRDEARAIETLSQVVTAGEDQAAQLAAMFLGDMPREQQRIVPVLESALLATRGLTSMHVAEALLKHDPTNVAAVSRLAELMRDDSAEVRWLTAHALGSVQGNMRPYAVEALRGGLRDVDSQVRTTSALSLGGLGDASRVAIAELSFISTHAEPRVRDAAKIALECLQ